MLGDMPGDFVYHGRQFLGRAVTAVGQQNLMVAERQEYDALHGFLRQFSAYARPKWGTGGRSLSHAASPHKLRLHLRAARSWAFEIMIHEIFPEGPLPCKCS